MNSRAIDIEKYIGKWYEIARIPNTFEYDMEDVTAEYIQEENNTITVINSGYVNGELKQITGIATTTEKDDLLNVSFFQGVKNEYRILAIDKNYQYALVGGATPSYLWILSRMPILTRDVYDTLVSIAGGKGYHVNNLQITQSLKKNV